MLQTKRLERVVKGFANHRRIQILELLSNSPNLALNEISTKLRVNLKTISEHTRRLHLAGLVEKKYQGPVVHHTVSPLGKTILKFLFTLSLSKGEY